MNIKGILPANSKVIDQIDLKIVNTNPIAKEMNHVESLITNKEQAISLKDMLVRIKCFTNNFMGSLKIIIMIKMKNFANNSVDKITEKIKQVFKFLEYLQLVLLRVDM